MQKTDSSILAQFFFADEELNEVAAELDSFDGRKDPERCTALVNKLRACQDKVLGVVQKIIDEAIGNQKANRDFRVKFPDDVLQENLAGQLWFGAEVIFFFKKLIIMIYLIKIWVCCCKIIITIYLCFLELKELDSHRNDFIKKIVSPELLPQ